jgi:enoyl-CoA hydratase/carnithine racemase
VLASRDGAVLTITLNRPDVFNAFNGALHAALHGVLAGEADDPSVRAVVVTGAGKGFCAGQDIREFQESVGDIREHLERTYHPNIRAIRALEKPVIAAINGPAVGFGITLTLAMDVRIASTAATMGFVFARRGVVPEACSTWFLPRLVGIAQAAEWAYTGRVFSPEEALAGGLVSRVVAPDALLPTARALAREIAEHTSAVSVALIRQMLWRMLGADHPRAAHRIDSLGMWYTGRAPDAHEGITSFLEKRPPRFTGRPSKDMPPFVPWWT